ncbi:phage repressor protein [Photobacterium kishitanii]|uniref:helix-turn-helix domain-containing protein n=1 Tax=Photobacterium kishitanii TaxID=318456 RepID=UPI000D151BCA|nr:S24 family peptidase [Photobacterium kishitanii]PSU89962.1 phage repressor protein [Photobacterium kishitanii]
MELGDRFKYRREVLGLTQEEVAKEVSRLLTSDKFNRVTVSNIELGNQQSMKDRVLLAVIQILKCNAEWLVNGKGSVEKIADSNVELVPIQGLMCPVISWEQAGNFTSIEHLSEPDEYSFYPSPVKSGPNTYILTVRDDSMSPKFEEGDLIYVDPNQIEAISGKYIIAAISEYQEVTFKQLQILDNQKLLKAINPDYPPELKYLKINNNCQILGTVVAHVKPL